MSSLADKLSERDRESRPIHYNIRKHAKAAATHRAQLREWVYKAHIAGIDHAEIADLAGTTITQVTALVEQVLAIDEQRDLVYASR